MLSSDPLLASLPLSRRIDLQQSSVSLGGFPTDFLRQVVRPLFLSFLSFPLSLFPPPHLLHVLFVMAAGSDVKVVESQAGETKEAFLNEH